MKNNNTDSRRKFLDKGLKLGLITAIGAIGLTKIASKLNAKNSEASTGKMELMTTDGTIIEVDSSEVMEMDHSKKQKKQEEQEAYDVREGMPNRKFVMVIDLAKCKNALKCQTACNKQHYITGEHAWLKVYKMQALYTLPTVPHYANEHRVCMYGK